MDEIGSRVIGQHFRGAEAWLKGCFDTEPQRKAEARTVRSIHGKGWDKPDFIERQRLAEINLDPFYSVSSFCGIAPIAIAGAFFQFNINCNLCQLQSQSLRLAVELL